MQIHSSQYLISSPNLKQCPAPDFPEYAFIGRSNVGKSSLINMLANRKQLARSSSTPGKTQLINYFLINQAWFFVDLPGYGYAKVSKSRRKQWGQMIEEYILGRTNLVYLFVLIDSRIPPQDIDLDFLNWLGHNQIPFVILFTKSDKLNPKQLQTSMQNFTHKLSATWAELPKLITTSAINKQGRAEILDLILQTKD